MVFDQEAFRTPPGACKAIQTISVPNSRFRPGRHPRSLGLIARTASSRAASQANLIESWKTGWAARNVVAFGSPPTATP